MKHVIVLGMIGMSAFFFFGDAEAITSMMATACWTGGLAVMVIGLFKAILN